VTAPAPNASTPADPAICRKCAAWGIACIHARNAIPRASATVVHTQSAT
jgi:hypothetical protein